jgi:hypothetical protein
MEKKKFKKYLKDIREIYLTGDYTEWTFRTSFENFINSLNSNFNVIQEPKRVINLGAPDFKSFFGARKIGSIETKNLGENLDEIIKTDQIKKYVQSIDNIILTDYGRFLLIKKGQKIIDLNLFSIVDLNDTHFSISDEKIKSFIELIDEFFDYKIPTIINAEELARELAKKAKFLKTFVEKQLKEDLKNVLNEEITSSIYDFYLGIKGLIKDINIIDGADAYAQTVTYSLLLARQNSPGELKIDSAAAYIPKNIGIIRRIFTNMSASDFPSNISLIISDVVDILNATDLDSVFSGIDKRGKKDKDPILFLYEDFLNFYEPEKKKKLGVYYTERPIVNFIVNSTHLLLKKHFDKPAGLADDTVTVLDPATGTGTFFWIAFLVVLNELRNQGLRGLIDEKIQDHLLKHFYGFEILITPYVIAHLKLADLLQRWHYRLKEDQRIQIYLTNTLEPSDDEQSRFIPFLKEIALENIATTKIKSKEPIIAIIGNPPYSGLSANKGKWIDNLLKKGYERADGSKDDGYYKVDDEALGEQKVWLQDDYVKFIRFAQWKIDKNGDGIVGFITNHSYLDNPTFRGMRESLLESFDRIYVLNLHGNALKQEKCSDGSKDENVFDIKQGVAITIFIKNSKFKDKKVFHSDLWGLKEDKFKFLDRHTVVNVGWQEIYPISPFYFFVPKDTSSLSEYENFWQVKDIFPVNNIGMIIQWTPEDVWKVVQDFANIDPEVARKKYNLRKDSTTWKVEWAQKDLKSTGPNKENIVKILYRPFDIRYTYYTGKSNGFLARPLLKVMKHMRRDNLGLFTCRQQNKTGFYHVFVTDKISDSDTVSNKTKERGYLFPLYVYSDNGKRTPNLNPKFLEFISKKYGDEFSPEEIFYYIYAILHSPKYRKKYAELLQSDFPRIPFIDDYEKFKKLSMLGMELAELHLMKKRLSVNTKFDVEGTNFVEKVTFKDRKLWINKVQYFDSVPIGVWNFRIGGYQVLDKWLKYKKNKKLSNEEIVRFLQVIEIIKLTIVIMKKIDEMLIQD